MLNLLALAAGLLVWGAHGVVPWEIGDAGSSRARLWRFLALPSAIAAAALWLTTQAATPDGALVAGFGPALPRGAAAVATSLALVALLGDCAALLRAPCGRVDLTVAVAAGACGAIAFALASELLRAGSDPDLRDLAPRVAIRLALALGAGETFAVARPRLAPFAALALAFHVAMLPPPLAHQILGSIDVLTLGAAVSLFAAARWLSPATRRFALLGATLLASLLLQRIATLETLRAVLVPVFTSSE